MKFDTVIIGGGLSGLVAGIKCAESGQKTAIITRGQSALHFWSGSFDLLGHSADGSVVENPFDLIDGLPVDHPYRRIGKEKLLGMMKQVPKIFEDVGVKVNGDPERNHYRLTPMGYMKPAWLTLDDYVMFNDPDNMPWKKVALVNIRGYIDFYPRFLAHGLEPKGVECVTANVDIPQLSRFRESTTEMRATNMARFLKDDAVDDLAREINKVSSGCEAVIFPAVLGLFSDKPVRRLRDKLNVPLYFVATTPASVPGVRCQMLLRDRFQQLRGAYVPGDTVTRGEFEKNRLRRIYTANFGDMPVEADNFVISTGSFFGHGLIATIDRIYEAALGLDVNVTGGRTDWYDKDFYAQQPYMEMGVMTDGKFRPCVKGETIDNLYATGALLSGFNALAEGSGAGITLATALAAAENITK